MGGVERDRGRTVEAGKKERDAGRVLREHGGGLLLAEQQRQELQQQLQGASWTGHRTPTRPTRDEKPSRELCAGARGHQLSIPPIGGQQDYTGRIL